MKLKGAIKMEITVNQIEKVLDQTLEELLSGKVKNKNVIFMGETGIGKTSVVEDWFKKRFYMFQLQCRNPK